MHRIAATPGGWNPGDEGVVFVEQTPAPIVFLTAADTDIQMLARAVSQLPPDFPDLRVANLLHLQQQLTIDTYAENVLEHAQVIILRVLGGRAYWSYGLEVVQETVQNTGATLIVLPGDDRPDPDLLSHSTVALTIVNQVWRYLTEGGIENFTNALQFIADKCLGHGYNLHFRIRFRRLGFIPASQRWDEQWKKERTAETRRRRGKFLTHHSQLPTLHPPKLAFSSTVLITWLATWLPSMRSVRH